MEIYETLWEEAVRALSRGEPQTDAHLLNKSADRRRGATIIARPSEEVRRRTGKLVEELRAICPEQYFYAPEELHVTVLSIISGTETWEAELPNLEACRPIIREVLRGRHVFRLVFRGVTASAGSVLIQGLPKGGELMAIRNELRAAFVREGFGGLLDQRFRISGAHMTAVRFRVAIGDWGRVLEVLRRARELSLGEMEVDRLELIWGDWYASAGVVQTLEDYLLGV